MHIVHLLDSSSRLAGGISEAVRGLTQAMSGRGVSMTILAGSDAHSEADRCNWAGVDVVNCPSSGFADAVLGNAMMAALDRLQPDLVHLHGIWGVGSRALARWSTRTGTPFVVSPHGMLDDWAMKRSAVKKKLSAALWENSLLRRAAFLHALTPSEADAMRRLGLDGQVAVIPNGVRLPASIADQAAETSPRKMLFLGRLHPKKGIAELVRAWAGLPQDMQQNWQLIVAGWDEIGMLDGLEQQVADHALSGRIIFPGGVHGADKDALYRSASAFILPSYSEGLPMAVLEAWSYSLPVFMTPECNLPEGFAAGAAIQISTDPSEMTRTLARALLDDDVLSRTGEAGRQLVEDRFGWDAIAADMVGQYAKALAPPENAL